jgi:glycosyltransferase involved in cell wall biosynthesis
VLAGAAAVVAVSSKVAAYLQDHVPAERLFVNLNGITGDPRPVPPADYLPDRRVLLTVGYLIERKGHAVVLDALRRLRDDGVAVEWAVAGDGPLRGLLADRAAELGVADAVHFLGRLPHPEVVALMARADLFVLPSWDEAFGLVYTEAMTQGTPIVACRGEGVEDFVTDGESGYLVPPRDPAALAAVLSRALGDEQERRRVGAAGHAAAAGLTWQHNAGRQLGIYREVLDGVDGQRPRPDPGNEEHT